MDSYISHVPFDILKKILYFLDIYEAYKNIIFIHNHKFIYNKLLKIQDLIPVFISVTFQSILFDL